MTGGPDSARPGQLGSPALVKQQDLSKPQWASLNRSTAGFASPQVTFASSNKFLQASQVCVAVVLLSLGA